MGLFSQCPRPAVRRPQLHLVSQAGVGEVGCSIPGQQHVLRRRRVAGGGQGRLHVPEGRLLRRAAVCAAGAQLWWHHDLGQILRQEEQLHQQQLNVRFSLYNDLLNCQFALF